MKLRLTSLAVLAAFATGAQAADTVISDGSIKATIADNGVFSNSTALGLSFNGTEFVNHGTWASWTWLKTSSNDYIQSQVLGTNGLNLTSTGISGDTSTAVSTGASPFKVVITTSAVGAINTLGVSVKIYNTSGKDLRDVYWGVGIDPDQDIPGFGTYHTDNSITGTGAGASVTALGKKSGLSVTLMNDTTAGAFDVRGFVNKGNCCSDVDPAAAYAANQGLGWVSYADDSINLAYNIGTLKAGQVATLGYNYVFAVPEPETYAMFLAGLGLMGVVARRRTRA